jgi:hypothetical protein
MPIDELDVIKEIKEKVNDELSCFPHGCCTYSSGKIESKTKLEMIDGWFLVDGVGHDHYWNYDPKTDSFVDITAKQFDSSLPEIYIVPRKI